MHALDPIPVSPGTLARWRDVALGFGKLGEVLIVELADFANDPVRHRLRRVADAVRDVVASQHGSRKAVAEALATEFAMLAES
ncbi:MAG: hypothetical protein AB7E81_22290 [Hyphomicrobiaceae bacterium]